MVTRPTFTWGSIDEAVAVASTGGAYAYRRHRYLTYMATLLLALLC